MAGNMWRKKAAYLIAARKQRKKKGLSPNVTIKGTPSMT
jgi:hypothetical protein